MGVSKNRGIPKCMVYTIKMDDLGGIPIFGNTHIVSMMVKLHDFC